jgi:hypothetical protein
MDCAQIKTKCDYCKNILIVPKLYAHKLLDKDLKRYEKFKSEQTLLKLQSYGKMSKELEDCIKNNNPTLYKKIHSKCWSNNEYGSFFIARDFLWHHNSTIRSTGIRCNFCNNEACDFHIIYGGFKFYKCTGTHAHTISNDIHSSPHTNQRHNIEVSICGWCQNNNKIFKSKLCIQCYDSKVSRKPLQNKTMHDIFDIEKVYINNINSILRNNVEKLNQDERNTDQIEDCKKKCNICFNEYKKTLMKKCNRCANYLICSKCVRFTNICIDCNTKDSLLIKICYKIKNIFLG